MGRFYKIIMPSTSVSVAQDLFQIKGAAGKIVRILRCKIACVDSQPTDQQLPVRARFLPATVTDGNGSAATIQKVDNGDAAPSVTAIVNSTTQAITSGTPNINDEDSMNIKAGWDNFFPDKPPVGPNESFVIELLGAPLSAIHLSGVVWVEEIGG